MFEPTYPLSSEIESGIRCLTSALSFEALRDAGWSIEDLLRLTEAVSGVFVVPTSYGATLELHWEKEPDEELQELAERMQDSAPMLLMAIAGARAPEVV